MEDEMIKFKKFSPDQFNFNLGANVRTKIIDTGVGIETINAYMSYHGCPIVKIDKDHYRIKRNGQIKEFIHNEKRMDNLSSVAYSMKKLRDIINYNVTDTEKVTWLTLTYAENMQDYNRLYEDYRKFNMRMKYYCKKNNLPSYEYIAVCEPQARGAWHMHIILIWSDKAPFIHNDIIYSLWKHGFTKTTAVKGNVDSLGYYLSAYLTDLPFDEALIEKSDFSKGVKNRNGKKYVKASRLNLYPAGINIYRCSRGIKKPATFYLSKSEADKLLESREADLTRRTLTCVYDDNIKPNSFGMFSQHCYYDTRKPARERYRMKRAYVIGKYYRTLYAEMLQIMESLNTNY